MVGVNDLVTAPETIAIVGGGASGVLAGVHLARRSPKPVRILLIDPGPELGGGAGFSTNCSQHVLNAPARAMSALDSEPEDFVRWLGSFGGTFGPDDFVPRHLYRLYLQDLLCRTQQQTPGGSTITWIRQRVVDISLEGDVDSRAVILRTASGQLCRADRAILAIGAPEPGVLTAFGVGGPPVVTNPWTSWALEGVPPDSDVFIVGTGLTTVDVVLALADSSQSKMHARSRHGMVAAVHEQEGFAPWPGLDLSGAESAREVIRRFRCSLVEAEEAGWGWRNVISAARDALPPIWESFPDDEKLRFLRHANRFWEVHRHRMSPQVSRAFDDVHRRGRLTIGAGRLVDIEERPGRSHHRFVVTLDGDGCRERLEVGALVDCSGPSHAAPNRIPLFRRLISRGLAAADPLGRGLAVNRDGAVLGSPGNTGLLYAIGWARSGRCFESMAVPALRKQAADLADRLSAPAGSSEHVAEAAPPPVPPILNPALSVA